jgi:uncharacterized membrane protein
MKYVFWAHLLIWVLVSLYVYLVQRKLALVESRVSKAERALEETKERENRDA